MCSWHSEKCSSTGFWKEETVQLQTNRQKSRLKSLTNFAENVYVSVHLPELSNISQQSAKWIHTNLLTQNGQLFVGVWGGAESDLKLRSETLLHCRDTVTVFFFFFQININMYIYASMFILYRFFVIKNKKLCGKKKATTSRGMLVFPCSIIGGGDWNRKSAGVHSSGVESSFCWENLRTHLLCFLTGSLF